MVVHELLKWGCFILLETTIQVSEFDPLLIVYFDRIDIFLPFSMSLTYDIWLREIILIRYKNYCFYL